MEAIRFDDLTFRYPLAENPALSRVSFGVEESEFLVVCGKSGCGKTTLLRQIKKNLIPYGEQSGEVYYYGEPVGELDDRKNAAEIGFVQQNPDNQIVTDKVWHELAFGLESLGMDNQSIRRRVAEMASYFDIQGWFRRDVAGLSGGQKQLLNLASIMVMQPRLLVLDEPTSQLDPIVAAEFLQTIHRINRELGITIVLSEHRLENVFPMADRILVMDEGGVLACDTPRMIGRRLAGDDHPMFHGLPDVTKIYHSIVRAGTVGGESSDAAGAVTGTGLEGDRASAPGSVSGESPITVREGRIWLDDLAERCGVDGARAGEIWREVSERAEKTKLERASDPGQEPEPEPVSGSECGNDKKAALGSDSEPAIIVKDAWFRYEKKGDFVLRDLNIRIYQGELYAVLGGNGVGKTTALKAIKGLITPERGKIRVNGNMAMLPQNPQALFSEITVEDDLLEALHDMDMTDGEKAKAVTDMLKLLEIEHLRENHPYDLSGGEQQRLALGKVLLLKPDILLLDEPTKGLDPFFKITLAGILKKLTSRGITIVMVSHDIEFCARYADRCGMFFDGGIVSEGEAKPFFAGNSFYTTVANRMARDLFPRAVTWEEVAECARELTGTCRT